MTAVDVSPDRAALLRRGRGLEIFTINSLEGLIAVGAGLFAGRRRVQETGGRDGASVERRSSPRMAERVSLPLTTIEIAVEGSEQTRGGVIVHAPAHGRGRRGAASQSRPGHAHQSLAALDLAAPRLARSERHQLRADPRGRDVARLEKTVGGTAVLRQQERRVERILLVVQPVRRHMPRAMPRGVAITAAAK